jgi:hypothetical protein
MEGENKIKIKIKIKKKQEGERAAGNLANGGGKLLI